MNLAGIFLKQIMDLQLIQPRDELLGFLSGYGIFTLDQERKK